VTNLNGFKACARLAILTLAAFGASGIANAADLRRLWLCRFLLSNVGPEMPHRSDAGGEPLWRNGTYAADSRLPIARALRGFRPVPVTLVHGKPIVRTARAVLEPDHQIAQD